MIQPHEYNIGLRVHHPSLDPRLISRRLKMRPRISWRVGEPRVTPTGTPLEGYRRDTYWSKTIREWVRVPSGNKAEIELTKLVRRLRPHSSFLNQLRRTGGRVEIWLSAYSTKNYSFTLQPPLIEAFHQLGCELVVDIYPYRQNWRRRP